MESICLILQRFDVVIESLLHISNSTKPSTINKNHLPKQNLCGSKQKLKKIKTPVLGCLMNKLLNLG
jgi:hypothetical protein